MCIIIWMIYCHDCCSNRQTASWWPFSAFLKTHALSLVGNFSLSRYCSSLFPLSNIQNKYTNRNISSSFLWRCQNSWEFLIGNGCLCPGSGWLCDFRPYLENRKVRFILFLLSLSEHLSCRFEGLIFSVSFDLTKLSPWFGISTHIGTGRNTYNEPSKINSLTIFPLTYFRCFNRFRKWTP